MSGLWLSGPPEVWVVSSLLIHTQIKGFPFWRDYIFIYCFGGFFFFSSFREQTETWNLP